MGSITINNTGSVIVKYEDSLDAAEAFLNILTKYKLNVQHKNYT